MKWENSDIEKLFSSANFSQFTDLKKRLLNQLMPKRKVSFEELESRYNKTNRASKENHVRDHSHQRQKEHSKDREGVMNNDKPMTPNR